MDISTTKNTGVFVANNFKTTIVDKVKQIISTKLGFTKTINQALAENIELKNSLTEIQKELIARLKNDIAYQEYYEDQLRDNFKLEENQLMEEIETLKEKLKVEKSSTWKLKREIELRNNLPIKGKNIVVTNIEKIEPYPYNYDTGEYFIWSVKGWEKENFEIRISRNVIQSFFSLYHEILEIVSFFHNPGLQDIKDLNHDCPRTSCGLTPYDSMHITYLKDIGRYGYKDFSIYQNLDNIFSDPVSFSEIEAATIDLSNYDKVYTESFEEVVGEPYEILEFIHETFSAAFPKDYHGTFLCVGDIVELRAEDRYGSYYFYYILQPIGWVKLQTNSHFDGFKYEKLNVLMPAQKKIWK